MEKVVTDIVKVNIIQDETIGFGEKSENFTNYELLKSKASINDLLMLTNHKNSTVNGYSVFALIDKKYDKIPEIYSHFLDNDKKVETHKGCIVGEDNISSEIYHYYWNSVKSENRENDSLLKKLDSITLYNENSYWLLLLRALENRVYSKNYNARIEYLAFQKTNRDAIYYLLNWYKADYKEKLKNSLLDYLYKTNFKDVGVTPYYETLEELFKFRDESINGKIVEKLKKDEFWKIYESKFISLLQDNGIYEFYKH